MGGVAKAVGGAVGDVLTLGTDRIAGSPTKKLGDFFGSVATGGTSGQKFGMGSGGTSSPSTPQMGQQSPLQMLQSSGGAPLLTSIALGVGSKDALASYFGIDPKDYESWKAQLKPGEQESIQGLESNLGKIEGDTNLKTQAVQNLVKDFPDFMASAIPKYKGIADEATMGAAQQALNQTAAKYAAGGQLSSGATAAAMARTGADFGYKNLQYGTELAGQDWMQKFNSTNALLNFQQKMLGQGATQGFNAIQNALQQNQQGNLANQNANLEQNKINQANSGSMFNALGTLAGTAVGGYFGGPMGASMGSSLGGSLAGGNTGNMSPSLNLGGNPTINTPGSFNFGK